VQGLQTCVVSLLSRYVVFFWDSNALVLILGYVWPLIGMQYSATSTYNPKITSDGSSHCLIIWVDFYILIYTHYLMKLPGSNGSGLQTFVRKGTVWDFVNETSKVMTTLVHVVFLLVWPKLTWLPLKSCYGVFSAISLYLRLVLILSDACLCGIKA
jgi:hypothetical protein